MAIKHSHKHYRFPMLLLSIIITIMLLGVITSFLQYKGVKKDLNVLQIQVQQLQKK
jgi:hypothetical protein